MRTSAKPCPYSSAHGSDQRRPGHRATRPSTPGRPRPPTDPGQGLLGHRRRTPHRVARAAAGREVRRRGAGPVQGVQGGPPWRGRLHGDGGRVRQVPRGRLLRAADRPRGAHRRVRHRRRRCRLRRPAAVAQAAGGRLRRRPLLREGRRRRRHLVLEPLPRHRLRRRVVLVLPAAGGDGLRPVDEVRLRLRDPRVLPVDGHQVRLLRPLPVPHHRRAHRVGRGRRSLDGVHRPRRRDAGEVRHPGQRHPHQPEAGPHPRDGDVRGHRLPHLAVGLQRRPRGQDDRDHRHRRHRRAGRSPSWPRSPGTSTCSSARRRRSTCATSAPPRPRRSRPGGTSRAGPVPAGPGSPRSPRGARRSRPTTTTSPARWPTTASARSTPPGCHPRS